MAMLASEVSDWLNSLSPNALVGVDEGGLCLRVVGDQRPYLEIGGIEDEDFDSQSEDDGEDT